MPYPSITDPAKTLERIYERLAEEERWLQIHEAEGRTYCATLCRRRIAGLKGARTRVHKMLEVLG